MTSRSSRAGGTRGERGAAAGGAREERDAAAGGRSGQRREGGGAIADERAAAAVQLARQTRAAGSKRTAQLQALAGMMAGADKATPVQRAEAPNRTGLPDELKSGIENLSGMRMDHVKVHYNSDKPSQLQAHAYAQGSDIHVAPGQEQHLPHEAWHVVQQAQGRVRPTVQMAGGVTVNDDAALEAEADAMGSRALAAHTASADGAARSAAAPAAGGAILQQKALAAGKLNVVGEYHPESNPRRAKERQYATEKTGGIYQTEGEFKAASSIVGDAKLGDPMLLRVEMLLAIQKEKVLPSFLTPISLGNLPPALGLPASTSLDVAWDQLKGALKPQLEEIALAMVYASREVAEQADAQNAERAHTELTALINLFSGTVSADVVTVVIPRLNTIIGAFASDVLGLGDIRAEAAVSALRSSAMQSAAATNAQRWVGKKKGVWKVGDSHIDEIRAEKTGSDYELLSKDEFNADFGPWLLQNP